MRILISISMQFALATVIFLTSCHVPPAETPSWVSGSVRSADGVLISYQTAGEGPISLVFVTAGHATAATGESNSNISPKDTEL